LEELTTIRTAFQRQHNFPGVIGCIDCTHVAIFPPYNNPDNPEYVYVNRKNYHSLNVQLICDDKLKITNVNASFPGSTHDSFIWNQSNASIKKIAPDRRNKLFFIDTSRGRFLARYS
jgi:hypothetical protein